MDISMHLPFVLPVTCQIGQILSRDSIIIHSYVDRI